MVPRVLNKLIVKGSHDLEYKKCRFSNVNETMLFRYLLHVSACEILHSFSQ